jgi:hypothetical protein
MINNLWACLVAGLFLTSCGGVGTDGTGPPSAASTVTIGALTGLEESEITVNGVAYDRTGATIEDGFGMALSSDDLQLGMWVEVDASADEPSGRAIALSVKVRPAVRGSVTAVDGASFAVSVLQSNVRYDNATTVVDGVDTAAALRVGDVVEVHGALGATNGAVEASRIERLAVGVRAPVELRGRVSNLDTVARTLTLGRQPVRYDTAQLTLRQAPSNGQVLRVQAAAAPSAGRAWAVERMTSDQPLPQNLGFVYVEGVTTQLAPGPLFDMEGLAVDATTASNKSVVTDNGQRVAVIGALVQGKLVAKSVARLVPGQPVTFVLSATVSQFESVANFRVRGVSIDARGATFVNGTSAELADGRRVRVTGVVNGRLLVATRVQFL